MNASEEPVEGKASETFHLLVDRLQQFREDHIQFVGRGADDLIAELSDSIIEATQSHEKSAHQALLGGCRIFSESTIPYIP
jgi:hypothetical protein